MQAGVMLVSVTAFLLIGFALVGGPMFLVDWTRKQWQTAIERQIALTDLLDGQLGPILAPVVKKPLFGPWEIHIAVPFFRSAMVARILAAVDEVFSGVEGAGSPRYRIFLTARPDSLRETRASRTLRPTKRWAGKPLAAA